jgi:hypothetical protein
MSGIVRAIRLAPALCPHHGYAYVRGAGASEGLVQRRAPRAVLGISSYAYLPLRKRNVLPNSTLRTIVP